MSRSGLRAFLRNLFYSVGAQFISLLLGICAAVLYPKYLNVAGYGYYQLYILYTCYLPLSTLGLYYGLQLEIAGQDYGVLNHVELNLVYWLFSLTQSGLYALLLVFVLTRHADPATRYAQAAACVVGLMEHSRFYLRFVHQATDRLRAYSASVVMERGVSILCGTAALALGFRDFRVMIALDVLGRYLSFGLSVRAGREIVFQRPRVTAETFRRCGQFVQSGALLLFAAQTSTLCLGVSRYGVERAWGIEAFGKISLALSLSNLALRCLNAVSLVMFPTLRNIRPERLPDVYRLVNGALMSLIFTAMIFFRPLTVLAGLWLPRYAESLRASVLFLPLCVYECKYSLLVNTNLKNLNRAGWIGAINALSVVAALCGTAFGIFALRRMEAAVFGAVVALALRCIAGELLLGRRMDIPATRNVVTELFLTLSFLWCVYFHTGALWTAAYAVLTGAYVFSQRENLRPAFRLLSGLSRRAE